MPIYCFMSAIPVCCLQYNYVTIVNKIILNEASCTHNNYYNTVYFGLL